MLPVILSIAGGLLPAVIDAFRSGKSPEEAAAIVAPKRREMIDRLTGSGMNGGAAEKMADDAMQGEIEKAQLPEPMNPWLSTALMAAGAYGGFRAGKAISGMRAAKTAPAVEKQTGATPSKQTSTNATETERPASRAPKGDEAEAVHNTMEESGEAHAVPRLTMGPQYRGKNQGPAPQPKTVDVQFERIAPFPGRPAQVSPEMNTDEARMLIGSGESMPGRNSRSFTMLDPFPRNIGLSPESANRHEVDRMRSRLYGREGG